MALQFKFQIIPYPQPLKVQKFFLAQGVQKKTGGGLGSHFADYCVKRHDQPKQHIKKQRHYYANKSSSSQSYGFYSSPVQM